MPKQLSLLSAGLTILLLPAYVVRFTILGIPSTLLEVLILFTLLIWLVERAWSKEALSQVWERVRNPLFFPGLILVVVAFVEALVPPDKKAGLGLWRAYFAEPFILACIVLEICRRFKSYWWVVYAVLGSGVWISLMAVVQIGTGQLVTADSLHDVIQGRAAAVFNSANALALYLGPIFALIVFLAMRIKKWLWIPALLIFGAIWLTKSEGAKLGLGAVESLVIAQFIWPRIAEKYRNLVWKILPLIGIISLVAISGLFLNISRFTPSAHFTYPRLYNDTKTIRLCLWEGTKNVLEASPILGTGLSGFHSAYERNRTCDSELLEYPHNIFLNFWTQTGLAGLGLFGFIIYRIFGLLKVSRDRVLGLGLAAGMAYLVIHGLVDVPYFKNDLAAQFWILAILSVLIWEKAEIEKS